MMRNSCTALKPFADIQCEVQGKPYREIVDYRDDRGEIQNEKECQVLESLRKGIVTHDSLFVLDRTGRQHLLSSVNAPIKNEIGKTIGVVRSMRKYKEDE